MPKDKSSGKKLADMLYGNPEKAAFGVFPQLGRRGQAKPAPRQAEKPFIDERAMELPQFGEVDLDVPTAANRAMGQRMVARDVDLKRQADQAMSPLEKVAGGLQAGRLIGSGLTQAVKSIPTAITKGGKAAEDYIAENIYQPNQPKAYEYAGDIADFLTSLETDYKIPPVLPEAIALQSLIGPATAQAGKAVKQGVRQGALNLAAPRTLNPQAGVIKTKGGNFLTGSVEGALSGLKKPMNPNEVQEVEAHFKKIEPFYDLSNPKEMRELADMQQHIQALKADEALNNWVDRNLGNYVKKEMATPEDPVRRLAEEGITHMPQNEIDFHTQWIPEDLALSRMRAGFPSEGLGQSNTAKGWEAITDSYINTAPASEYTKPLTESEVRRGLKSVVEDNPWLSKLDPDTPVQYLKNADSITQDLRLDHIMDVLREDLTSGRIRPEQLSKVSMEQAVRRTAEYDQELAKKMDEARVAGRAGLPVYKEYPEGYRWVELNKPGAFASESEAMGHSVRGYEPPQGHPDWVAGSGDRGSLGYGHGGWEAIKSGKAKVYSLVDPKGNPHVTVEVGKLRGSELGRRMADLSDEEAAELYKNAPSQITQIKGKQNQAPGEDYLPFVQDFVKSGRWSDVGDLGNTGLYSARDVMNYMPENFTMSRNARQLAIGRARMAGEMPDYMTKAEYEAMLQKHAPEDIWNAEKAQRAAEDDELLRQLQPPPEGMARGGRVHISDNPDVMQLELAGGGLVKKLAKLARAPAKSKQEIEAIAERMAPQVTGEYVRESPKSAKTVAGKTQKQFQREKTLPVDVRPTDKERIPQTVDIEKLKGDVMIGIPGDPTLAGKSLYGVGDVKLGSPSPQHGGPLYGLYNDENFWASGLGAARRVQNLAKEAGEQYDAPVAGKYIMMGPDSINYAQHFADANLQAIDLDRMTKRQVEQFNKLIRFGNPKSGPRPSFPGIEDKESAYLHMAMDPELRKHFNELMQKPTVTETLNLPSGTDIRFAITEPALRDLETGVTGFSMGRMRPEISSKDLPLSAHPTYSHDIPGEFMGQSRFPIPYELSFPDTLKSIRENPAQAPHEFGSLKMVGPRQTIDQQMIDEIKAYEERMKQLTGKKAGGAVRKAAGGEITADDLILEERKL